MSLDSFLVSILFDSNKTQESAKKIEDVVSGLKNKIIGSLASLASIDFLKNMVQGSIELATKLDNLSYITNVSKESLSAWGEAVKRNGGTTEGFYASITSLAEKIRDMQTSYGSAGQLVFARLGVNLRNANGQIKNAAEVLVDLGDKFKKLPKDWQINLGKQLGLDPATIRLISNGSKEAQNLVQNMAKYAQLSNLNTEGNTKLRNTFYDISLVFESIKIKLANDLMPIIQKFSEMLLKGLQFLQEHSTAVKLVLTILATLMSGVLLSSIIGVTRALTAMAVAMLKNPIVWYTGLLIALVLVIQDFIVYVNGGKSALSGFWSALTDESIIKKLDALGDKLKAIFSPLTRFFDKYTKLIRDFFGIKQVEDPLMQKIDEYQNQSGFVDESKDQIKDRIRKTALELGVDPNVALGVAQKESNFNPDAKNARSSASGIFQLTDATARENGITDLSRKNDLDLNIRAGVLNLKKITDGLTNYFKRAPTPAEVSIGEMLGLAGSEKVFGSNKNTMLSTLFGDNVLKANPQFRNMTSGQLISNANKTFQQQSVTVGEVKINAPNSNAREISKRISGELQKHLSSLVTNVDNGVRA